jgi:AcrR family transcriptional regulator
VLCAHLKKVADPEKKRSRSQLWIGIFRAAMSQPARRPTAARSSRQRRGVPVSRAALRPSQRERLIDAIVELAGQSGYQTLSIAQISARAGVSSATFYEQFEDREACLLAAYKDLTERTLARMATSLREGEWASAARPAFTGLLRALTDDPNAGRVMFVEALAGGPRLRSELRSVLDGMEQSAEVLLDRAPVEGVTLDIPGRALIGAVRHVVSRHLRRHSEDQLPGLTEEMLSWMGCYAVPARAGRWSVGPTALLASSTPPPAPSSAPSAPERLPRGRHGLPPGAVARSQRSRILQATAAVSMEKGYANTTVADVVAAAGVAKEAFYRHFRDREQAFLEAQEHPTQQILDLVVRSYFSAEEWHERIWRGLGTLLELIAADPVMSHLRLVECYTAGPAAVHRAEETTRSFTIFLEEGYRQRPEAAALPRLWSQAIAGAIFEIIQQDVAAGRTAELPRRRPQLTYLATAPFLGPQKAIELLQAKGA